MSNNCITITFGDQAENHVGMQKIGKLAECGFKIEELELIRQELTKKDVKCEHIKLNKYLEKEYLELNNLTSSDASILIIRNFTDFILKKINKNSNDFFSEQNNLIWDKKVYMYGRVCNKKARYNLCYGEKNQEAEYINKKGKIVAFDDIPITKYIRENLDKYFGEKAKLLMAEGNLYYDINKCGIGFHGDSERKKVIAIRLGKTIPLHFQWFHNSKPTGERIKLEIGHGDLYIMSEKATGNDWKKKKILTLRHAAGCEKFLKIKQK